MRVLCMPVLEPGMQAQMWFRGSMTIPHNKRMATECKMHPSESPSCVRSPSLIYLVLKRPSVRSWHFWASWTILILCVIVTLLGSIGAMRGIITAASGFHFYE